MNQPYNCNDCLYYDKTNLAARVRELEAAYEAKGRETAYVAAERDRQRIEIDAAITANVMLQRENDALRALLEWLNRRGGLGLDVHNRIDAALAGEKPC